MINNNFEPFYIPTSVKFEYTAVNPYRVFVILQNATIMSNTVNYDIE